MSRWGRPPEYAWMYSVSSPQYQRQMLAWLEWENPALHQLVLKEIARGTRAGHSNSRPAGAGQAEE